MGLSITTEIKEGIELQFQTAVFQAWFNENCSPKIDFADTCAVRDEWNRPLEWHFDECKVIAVYYTENVNYNFNKFLIYGTI